MWDISSDSIPFQLWLISVQAVITMQFGYGKKNKKKKVKKTKASKAAPSGDDVMADVEVAHPSVAQMEDVAQESAMSARDKQRHRMELKSALRVRVNSLKSSRCAQLLSVLQGQCAMPLCITLQRL